MNIFFYIRPQHICRVGVYSVQCRAIEGEMKEKKKNIKPKNKEIILKDGHARGLHMKSLGIDIHLHNTKVLAYLTDSVISLDSQVFYSLLGIKFEGWSKIFSLSRT